RRPPDQALLAVEEDLQRPRQPAHDAIFALPTVVLDEAREGDLAAERQLGLLGVPQIREQALRLARCLLHAVEKRREARLLAPEALAAEDRDRHEEGRPTGRLALADDVAQVLRPQPGRSERPPPPPRDRLAPHEEEHRLALRH